MRVLHVLFTGWQRYKGAVSDSVNGLSKMTWGLFQILFMGW